MFSHSTTLWLLSADRLSSASVKTNRREKRYEGSAADAAASSRIQRLKRQKKPRWNFGENRRLWGHVGGGTRLFKFIPFAVQQTVMQETVACSISSLGGSPTGPLCSVVHWWDISPQGWAPSASLPSLICSLIQPPTLQSSLVLKMWKEVCPF